MLIERDKYSATTHADQMARWLIEVVGLHFQFIGKHYKIPCLRRRCKKMGAGSSEPVIPGADQRSAPVMSGAPTIQLVWQTVPLPRTI